MNLDDLARLILRRLSGKEILKMGSRTFYNTFRYPRTQFDVLTLFDGGGDPEFSGIPPIWTREDVNELLDHGIEKPFHFLCFVPDPSLPVDATNPYTSIYGGKRKAGQRLTYGTDASTVIQSTFNALTSERISNEVVKFKGKFIIDSTILVPAYTTPDLWGSTLKLADGANVDMFRNEHYGVAGDPNIRFIGGELYGNYENQGVDCRGIVLKGPPTQDAFDFLISHVHIREFREAGIKIHYAIQGRVIGCYLQRNAKGKTEAGCYVEESLGVTMTANLVYDNSQGLMTVNSSSCVLNGNICWEDQMNISVFGSCVRNSIIGNTCRDSYAPGYGIILTGWPGNYPSGIKILGNTLYNAESGNLYMAPDCTKIIARDNEGFNPVGLITSPFHSVSSQIVPFDGNLTSPDASIDYVVMGIDILITSTGGTGVSISIKDPAGNTVVSGLATLSGYYLPVDYKINFGAFTVAPTVLIFGI